MMGVSNTSIKQHLTSMIMSISSISVLVTTIAISIIGVYNLKTSLREELAVSASIVADRNLAYLTFGSLSEDSAEAQAAENNLRVFSVNKAILQACLFDKWGNIFARYPNEGSRTAECSINLTPRNTIEDERIEVLQEIRDSRGLKEGYIYIESNLSEVESYVRKQSTIGITVTLTVLILCYFLAINIQKTISKPILSLAATAQAVSENKDYTIRAHPFGDKDMPDENEITTLTEAFNSMLGEIDARETQLKQKNIELGRARDVAESANRAKSQFLANISHELRTPLNAVIGFSSILMNQLFGDLGDKKYLEYAKDINESGTHLLDIINDILDLSKAEAGKLVLNYEEVHVPKAINKCFTILADRAKKANVTVSSDVPRTLPPLLCDRLRFIQILLNIFSNAIKFTEEGGRVTLTVTTKAVGNEVTDFIFTITDTGIGMAQEDIDKALQSFGQVDGGLDRKYEGIGLGLPLTKKLVELHHGTINVESELGVGTIVSIRFPAIPPAPITDEQGAPIHIT